MSKRALHPSGVIPHTRQRALSFPVTAKCNAPRQIVDLIMIMDARKFGGRATVIKIGESEVILNREELVVLGTALISMSQHACTWVDRRLKEDAELHQVRRPRIPRRPTRIKKRRK